MIKFLVPFEGAVSRRITTISQPRQNTGFPAARQDGRDALYGTTVEIDEDAVEEYWVRIRKLPKNMGLRSFKAYGKY